MVFLKPDARPRRNMVVPGRYHEPADHSRSQGAEERTEGWLNEMLRRCANSGLRGEMSTLGRPIGFSGRHRIRAYPQVGHVPVFSSAATRAQTLTRLFLGCAETPSVRGLTCLWRIGRRRYGKCAEYSSGGKRKITDDKRASIRPLCRFPYASGRRWETWYW